MIHTICYFSNAVPKLTKEALETVMTITEENNKDKNITGILLYYESNFFQVLEGEKEALSSLYAVIKKDKRHENIHLILDRKIEIRTFENYKSGFSIVKNSDDLKNIKVYLEQMKDSIPESTLLLEALYPFFI